MLLLLGGASQTLATETDLRLFSNEQENQVIKPVYPLWLNYVNRLTSDDKLFRALRYNPIHPSLGYYHLSAVNHTSPVAVYIITFSPQRLLLLMNVSLSVQSLFLDNPISIATV